MSNGKLTQKSQKSPTNDINVNNVTKKIVDTIKKTDTNTGSKIAKEAFDFISFISLKKKTDTNTGEEESNITNNEQIDNTNNEQPIESANEYRSENEVIINEIKIEYAKQMGDTKAMVNIANELQNNKQMGSNNYKNNGLILINMFLKFVEKIVVEQMRDMNASKRLGDIIKKYKDEDKVLIDILSKVVRYKRVAVPMGTSENTNKKIDEKYKNEDANQNQEQEQALLDVFIEMLRYLIMIIKLKIIKQKINAIDKDKTIFEEYEKFDRKQSYFMKKLVKHIQCTFILRSLWISIFSLAFIILAARAIFALLNENNRIIFQTVDIALISVAIVVISFLIAIVSILISIIWAVLFYFYLLSFWVLGLVSNNFKLKRTELSKTEIEDIKQLLYNYTE
ncbi:hypothetical protein F8M41_020637 [Gigaspora margarita]|uniref:Uncharacterized protein n=1 Tax=Gigaspora margarita TaxID=4874 RepID=A0A8H4EJK5_GIGMA|nr:hypothetical protein F8M41_020637 [Gigaspora margarita]